MKNCFSFKLVDIIPFTSKNGKSLYRVILYCNFGFVVNIFITSEKYNILSNLQKNEDFNINDYINVFYDNSKQSFAYIINL